MIESDGKVFVEKNYEIKDNSYYFEAPEIDGVIIKREHGNYCIKASVKYINVNNQNLWFAKIRIENSYDGDIQIMGNWSGSWEDPDYEDEDFIKKYHSEFPFALKSMKSHLADIYNNLCKTNKSNSDLYDASWVKKLKKYNN